MTMMMLTTMVGKGDDKSNDTLEGMSHDDRTVLQQGGKVDEVE